MSKNKIVKVRFVKKASFWGTFFDFAMVVLTGGLWLIWILIRYLRTH